jgi:predicted nuclease of predicted toxin-antitoxin system
MKFWIDAQLSPALAPWITDTFAVEAFSVQRLGLRDASDEEIFFAARAEKAVVITKDQDFVQLLEQLGPPPKVIWVTCGNISNAQMRDVLLQNFQSALLHLQEGKSLVEIPDLTYSSLR